MPITRKHIFFWRSRKRLAAVFAVLLISTVVYTQLFQESAQSAPPLSSYQKFPELSPTDRLTIISPHLDDETLGAGGLIADARAKHLQVSVIFMTNGDDNPIGADLQFRTGYASPDQLIQSGIERQKESILALQILGVPEENIFFLGLPDRGLLTMYRSTRQKAYRSPGTLKDSSPYPMSYIHDLPYTATATKEALKKAIEETRPTLLFTTAQFDKHSDHVATALFTQDVYKKLSFTPKLYYYLVHASKFPRPKGIDSGLPLLPPRKEASRDWQIYYISELGISQKKVATDAYKTQLRIPQLGRLMRSMTRQNELFLPH